MAVTNTDNQAVGLPKKIEDFFWKTKPSRKNGFCPMKDLMAATTDKWSIFILFNLGYSETLRFSELRQKIKSISSRMLSVTLKKLEKCHLVERTVYAEVPPRVEYRLTDLGKAFAERMVDLNNWYFEAFSEKNGA